MGHFSIELPENKRGDVKRLAVIRVQFSKTYKVGSKSPVSESIPVNSLVGYKYLIAVSEDDRQTEFHLFKSQNGKWSKDPEGRIKLNDHPLIIIKNAIVKKEKELNLQ
jgi:hypothetical protein